MGAILSVASFIGKLLLSAAMFLLGDKAADSTDLKGIRKNVEKANKARDAALADAERKRLRKKYTRK